MHVVVDGTEPTTFRFGPSSHAEPLAVTLFRHSGTDVGWLASGQAVAEPGSGSATFSVTLDSALIGADVCVEVRAQRTDGKSIDLDEAFFTLSSASWSYTPNRPDELRQARTAYFSQPVIAPGTTTTAPSFRAVALIEGLLLTQNTRVRGIEVYALRQTLGSSDATVGYLGRLSQELFGLGFASDAGHSQEGLPCVALKFADVRAGTADDAMAAILETARRIADLLGFNRHARPQVVGAAMLDASTAAIRYWLDPSRTQYTGNLIGGFIAGESTQDLLTQWAHMDVDPRLALWLSQINDARADRRWEYRVLRHFNLLEGIAKGSIGTKVQVVDEQGQPLFQDNHQPYTSKEARGAVYMVVAGLCRQRGDISENAFCAYASLWELCQHWTTVRNQVAHAGSWESSFKVGGTDKVEAYLSVSPEQRRTDLESVLAECVRLVVDGVIFRGYLPL